jgi:hypothetical protein
VLVSSISSSELIEMAESDVSAKVRGADNEILAVVGHNTSLSDTGNGSSIRLAAACDVSMEDCNYLRVISDVLISGEMPLTEDDSKLDADPDSVVASTHSRSQCVQQQQCQEDSNSTTIADSNMYMTAINDINDHVYTIINADSELTDSVSTRCN